MFLAGHVFKIGWFADKSLDLVVANIWIYVLFATPLAYAAAIVLGIPAYLLATRCNHTSMPASAAFGAAVALLPLLFYFAFIIVSELSRAPAAAEAFPGVPLIGVGPRFRELVSQSGADAAWWLFLFATSGATAGLVFWAIALRRSKTA